MGERKRGRGAPLTCSWNGAIRIEGRDEALTGDAGALLLRELDTHLGLSAALARRLVDPRDAARCTHPLPELLRQRLYLLALGHADQDDADRLRHDPALRLAVSERRGLGPLTAADDAAAGPTGLASQPTHSRLLAALATPRNRAVLGAALFDSARRKLRALPGAARLPQLTLDVDSFPVEVHGHQPGSAYNGHYGMRCYHPLAVFGAELETWLGATLRPGNVHTADGVAALLLPLIGKVRRSLADAVAVRGDAGFPEDGLLTALEARSVPYAFRLRTNPALDRLAAPLLTRPPGRPPAAPREWCHELTYQAAPWSRPRRVVCVVLERPGELFLDYFFLLTSWTAAEQGGPAVLEFYRQRGTFEGLIGELQSALSPRLSSPARRATTADAADDEPVPPEDPLGPNTATFLLVLLAQNLAGTLRRLGQPRGAPAWRLTRVRETLLRVAARCVVSARRVTVIVTDAARAGWAACWRAVQRLTPQPVVT